MLRHVVRVALVLGALLAGCAAPAPAGPARDWGFGGTFSEEATQADIEQLGAQVRARFGVDVVVLESFPMQLRVSGLTSADCTEARALVASKAYVAHVGPCASSSP